jgi:hypothetical protein
MEQIRNNINVINSNIGGVGKDYGSQQLYMWVCVLTMCQN